LQKGGHSIDIKPSAVIPASTVLQEIPPRLRRRAVASQTIGSEREQIVWERIHSRMGQYIRTICEVWKVRIRD
jgi:hypothetical protein